ncbi:hypothetical protein [Bradyrhizobium sp. Ai1a-2]|uniref:hypothetical protein n=1 Tax=Bradyrhizobium sp. Ai1a-2 TaxID=196490 RepID=UPI0012687E69|nr:hypothetical protein [Bradyrhizobium sp. Ai1a-2]
MADPDRNGMSARLWRIPRQLLLALINAMAILVIVAAILALVAMARINHFAEHVAATMTDAVLAKVDLPPKAALANLQNLTAEVRTLGSTLRQIKSGEHPALQSDIEQLKEALTALNISVDRLGNARSLLTDEAIEQLGRTVTDALMRLRDCSPNARQATARGTAGNKTVGASEEQAPVKSGLYQRRSGFFSAVHLE